MDHCLEATGGYPTLRLLVNGFPRREVVREHPPGGSGAHDPPQGVEDLTQIVGALRGVLADQCQVRGHESPFLVAHVSRIRLPVRHVRMLTLPTVHNTLYPQYPKRLVSTHLGFAHEAFSSPSMPYYSAMD